MKFVSSLFDLIVTLRSDDVGGSYSEVAAHSSVVLGYGGAEPGGLRENTCCK